MTSSSRIALLAFVGLLAGLSCGPPAPPPVKPVANSPAAHAKAAKPEVTKTLELDTLSTGDVQRVPVESKAPPAGTKPAPPGLPPPPDVASPPADATKLPSGMAFRVLKPGNGGGHPNRDDLITVHYTGWKASDGSMLDSSEQRGTPLTVGLSRTLKGWVEGIQLMTVGEKRRFWIPQDLAFQNNPKAEVPKGTIVYDIELLKFEKAPIDAPSDVHAPPSDAVRSKSGLAWKVLRPGTGTKHPGTGDTLLVHFSGWEATGQFVTSSVIRGAPIKVRLGDPTVMKGWYEALPLMVEGEKRRLWIPANLALKGQEGRPQGDLVYDVELLKIDN